MTRQIKESDWKILRQLHREALERFCEQILLEVERISRDRSKSFHQRYLDMWEVLKRRDKELGDTFNDLRRSTAFFQLASMKGRGVLTDEEFSRFSEETRCVVDRMLND